MSEGIGWLRNAMLALGSLVLCGLALEGAARLLVDEERYPADGAGLMVVPSENPRLVYELRPSHRIVMGDVAIATNAAGFRDDEFSREKPPATRRIAAIGDSVAFGFYVEAEQAFPQRLEARARARGERVEVLNLGVPGYNSLQEVELIRRRALALAPDLLLIAYVLNDNKEDGGDGGLSRYFKRSPSRAFDWLRIRGKRIWRRLARDVTTEAFEELAAALAGRDLPVVVVIFPLMKLEENGSYGYHERHEQVTALSHRLGFEVLDLLEAFRAAGLESLKARRDKVHPNARGHALAAERTLEFLRDKGLLGGSAPAPTA